MSDQEVSDFLSLSGKVAIVTGASRGLGVAMAQQLAKRGAKVRGIGSFFAHRGTC